ncbi:miniconductance mechanosensitive channel [Pedobacter psychrotolerans]|uniref:Mechanosensitive ion channel protein MscS n=1 Tax=Pedobacter psychrotolerans TaxID=1843235 RepID=A0A4R2HLP9_9SPHI|nr:mechanosensitive ion channel domain-containing protein [Pedobacter psychrotolerans]TCO30635.1 miniconductance mechanosensitive channel [Pedobacter psychrotolerans]GGE68700.1 mechanosensitive ion channel protein MscS [Pedobacter psychrotolerans]
MNLFEFESIFNELRKLLIEHGLTGSVLIYSYFLIGSVSVTLFLFITIFVTRQVFIGVVKSAKTKSDWQQALYEFRVFRAFALIFGAYIIYNAVPYVFIDFKNWFFYALIFSKIYVVLATMFAINAFLNALVSIMETSRKYADKPIRSYKQVAKIIIYIFGFVLILSIILNQSLLYIFGGFGAVTAVFILVFRDPILGFVASVQMSAIDLVRVGDWITVEKYGADGEVTEINLTTIKVRNWDKTVTIVPSYAIVSESFKNWRAMEESEGRRIKRHINIKISSIKFCDDDLISRLQSIDFLKDYLKETQLQIEQFNAEHTVNPNNLVNGRHMTNIGTFRVYAEKYLESNPSINTDLTFMVRQLQATENGLPIEIYVFSKEKGLKKFEEVAADIFDHLLAAVPYFDLEIFQSPSGSDMRGFVGRGND